MRLAGVVKTKNDPGWDQLPPILRHPTVLYSHENICRSQCTNQEGVRFAHRTDLCFAICRFSQVVFFFSQAASCTISFSISNSFWFRRVSRDVIWPPNAIFYFRFCIRVNTNSQAAVTYRFPSDHRGQAPSSGVSTWMGDHPGTPRAVGNIWCTRHMAKPRPQVGRVC